MLYIYYRDTQGNTRFIPESNLVSNRYRWFMGEDYNPYAEAKSLYGDDLVCVVDTINPAAFLIGLLEQGK